jgi:Flp pilus assembly protein CpaB
MPPATTLPPRTPIGPNGPGRAPRRDRSKLLSTRRGAVAVAVIAGLAALTILLVFMSNYRSSVTSEGETIHVLVAGRQLDSGTSGEAIAEAGLFKTTEIRREEADEGALTSVGALRGKHLTTTIDSGQQLTAGDFASGSEPIAGRLEGTDRALSVPVNSARGNIGQVKDGSRVDVLGGFNAEEAGGRALPVLDILARDVLVLSAPEKASSGIGSSKEQDVVLRLSDREAARVAFAADHGNVWLAIRPPTLAKDSRVNTVRAGSLLGAGE